MYKKTLAICFIGLSVILQTRAQLAITEVMTSATGSNPDWWELTNLGTNNVDLTGYSWNDDSHGGFAGATNTPFAGVIIHTNESVIFTEQKGGINTVSDFRTWWGISPGVQVIILGANPGLGAGGDTVRLWSTNLAALGANTNGLNLDLAPEYLVDRVDTTAATTGFSLVYNTNNGTFGINSAVGVDGAFQAATTTDVGSPGFALTNPAPIVITSQPSNVLVNVGAPVTFQITAYGFPKPRFQWLFNGVPVDTNVAQIVFTITNNYCRSTLTITNVQVTNAGTFRVNVTNRFQTVVSSNATLTVNTSPFAPIFTQTPATTNLYAYLGQTINLSVSAFGNPPPTFVWQFNGTNINGQADSQYTFNLTGTNQAGIYTAIATNSAGGTNTSVVLTITPKPILRITEILSSEQTNSAGSSLGHNDWWELSNLGTFPVNLQGFRFDDDSSFDPNAPPFSQALSIAASVIIAPGESIVLVEDMTPDDFRTWWGPENLPPGLQIIPYHGSGLSFSGTRGDALTVWNAAATALDDFIDSESIAVETSAISFCIDPVSKTFSGSTPDGLSVLGVNGAFAADVNGDIGSPGTVVTYPKFTGITRTNGGTQISWVSQPNFTYTVQFKTNLTEAAWTTWTNVTPTASTWNLADPGTNTQRFYRLILNLGIWP